jgi:hypothetical protein
MPQLCDWAYSGIQPPHMLRLPRPYCPKRVQSAGARIAAINSSSIKITSQVLSDPASKWLDNVTGQELLQDVDTIIFDCDGVLWRGNEIIPCAVEVLT